MSLSPAACRPRVWAADALRGLALLNMLAYHALYDWVYIFGLPCAWYDISSPGCHVWQQYICWSFILLAGFSFPLSRRPWRHGLIVAGCAVALSVVTAAVLPAQAVRWGVLHLIAASVLLCCAARPALDRVPPAWGLAVSGALFVLTRGVPAGYFGFEGLRLAPAPAAWYAPNLYPLGLPDLTRFSSSDYFPLAPWLFLFLCGVFLCRLRPALPAGRPPKALAWLCCAGRHTLFVYMLHQPVLYGALLAARSLGWL